ncbi:MAG: CHAT domain-containing protein [Verrucomicrobia bacterium]|nr:CHAT domain-containing protein [Leptolyngbya sp. ES-bin-22]
MEPQLETLRDILHINALCKQLPPTVDTLILLPHRDLHRFPLHTLFPDRFTASYLPSLQIGLNLRDRAKNDRYSPLLNVDDPETDQPAMPFAQLESAIVRQLVQHSIHLSPTEASLDKVVHALEASYKTFHFTGHGAYNARKPEESAIALTDGLLTAKTISHLNLSSYKLVCLAACETALTGKDGITTEYVGLASAFLKAGAANVLSTLWQVDEISSTWLMLQFYQRLLAGDTPATALKQSQHWLRTITWAELAAWITELSQLPGLEPGIVDRLTARAKNTLKEGSTIGLNQPIKYSNPYYWAAFTLTGQG